jgi:hypothetical protein
VLAPARDSSHWPKSDIWYPNLRSVEGGKPTFAEASVGGEVAPIAVTYASAPDLNAIVLPP